MHRRITKKSSCGAFLHHGETWNERKDLHAECAAKIETERMCGYERKEGSERESDQAEVQPAANVETAISIVDVSSIFNLADCF